MVSYITPPQYFVPYEDILTKVLVQQDREQPITICDIGTGNGQVPLFFAKILNDIGAQFQISGIDLESKKIEYATDLLDPQNLAKELELIHLKEKNLLNDTFITQWINELKTSESSYLKNVSFLNEDISNLTGLNADVLILNHALEYLSEADCETMLNSWNKTGPIIIKTAYPSYSQEVLSTVCYESLTFGVLDRRHYPRTDRTVEEFMFVYPTKRLNASNPNIDPNQSYIFDVLDVSSNPLTFETEKIQLFDQLSSSSSTPYNYYSLRDK